jgi:hypothetical protein
VFEHQIDVAIVLRPDDLLQLDDIGMRELHQEHDLTVRPLGIRRVIEGVKVLFEGLDLP